MKLMIVSGLEAGLERHTEKGLNPSDGPHSGKVFLQTFWWKKILKKMTNIKGSLTTTTEPTPACPVAILKIKKYIFRNKGYLDICYLKSLGNEQTKKNKNDLPYR